MKKVNRTRLSAAAFLFTQGNNTAKGLAEAVGVSAAAIYKWVKLPEWEEALDDLGYKGDRAFKRAPCRDIERDSATLFEPVKAYYLENRAEGLSEKKAVTAVCEVYGLKRRRVNEWRDKFDWEKLRNSEEAL